MSELNYNPSICYERLQDIDENKRKEEDNKKNEFEIRTEKLNALIFKLRRARWLHRRASKYYHPRNIIMVALSFVISSSISILSISSTSNSSNTTSNTYIGYIITITGFLNGFITLLTNQLDYKTKTNNNILAAKAYDSLITKVSFEINFPSDIPCNEFVGLIEENILKIKNELEVYTEERFEKEVNKLINENIDISSEAGYCGKDNTNESLFNRYYTFFYSGSIGGNGTSNINLLPLPLKYDKLTTNYKNYYFNNHFNIQID